MKGEYAEEESNRHRINMFSKLHHHQFHPFAAAAANPFHRECHTSDDTAAATTTPPSDSHAPPPSGDGATIEVVRRPRGRPPGSKNKPKPPVIITRDSEPAMSPYILEIPAGNDVVDAITRFCKRKSMGLCVLTGSGAVANVTLRQPSTTPGATVTFHGRFDILSVSAAFLPQSSPASGPSLPAGFSISLAGPQGQIVGGIVAGALVAAGTVFIVGASFNSPSYHRLPAEAPASASGEGESPAGSGGGDSAGHAGAGESSGGMAMYGCHVAPSEVIWAPTARQPPPY